MVKAEKAGLGRRMQPAGAHGATGAGGVNSLVGAGANGSNQPLAHEFGAACDQKNVAGVGTAAAGSGSCVIQANVTPIRSMSMREKRLAELENGTNSLPRTYTGRCTSCTYCSAVVTTCSPCCLSAAPMNVCPSYYVKVTMPSTFSFTFNCCSLRLCEELQCTFSLVWSLFHRGQKSISLLIICPTNVEQNKWRRNCDFAIFKLAKIKGEECDSCFSKSYSLLKEGGVF